jgi:hypothetical protein
VTAAILFKGAVIPCKDDEEAEIVASLFGGAVVLYDAKRDGVCTVTVPPHWLAWLRPDLDAGANDAAEAKGTG